MPEKSREQWIQECASYIRQKAERDAASSGTDLSGHQAITKREEVKERLSRAQQLSDRLFEALSPLCREIDLDGLPADFGLVEDHLGNVSRMVNELRAKIAMAQAGLPPAKTREKPLHRAAAKLAYAFDPVSPRPLAREIMAAADLDECSDPTLTRYLKEASQS